VKLALGVAVCLSVTGMIACTRDPVAPRVPLITSGPSFDLFVQPPGEGGRLCFAFVDGPAFGGNWWDPRGSNCRTQMHPSPLSSLFHDADTGPYDVIADFSEPVSNLVITPLGPWMCGGDPGSFTVSTASGESVTFAMPTPDESDCDRVVYVFPQEPECSDHSIIRNSIPQGVPVGVADIVRVVIHPNSPLHFTEFSYQNDGTCGFIEIPHEVRASTTYILAFREFPVVDLRFDVSCDPQITRRSDVRCFGRVSPAQAFSLVRKQADAEGHSYVDNTVQQFAAGQEVDWVGPAIVDTRVTFEIEVSTSGGLRRLQDDAGFVVIPQTWPVLVMPPLPAPVLTGGPPTMPYPPVLEKQGQQVVPDGALGLTEVIYDNIGRVNVPTGPNTNWFYIPDPVTIASVTITLNRGLDASDPFYKAQVGNPPGQVFGPKFCGPGDMQSLRNKVIQHENAHHQAYVTYFAGHDVSAQLEAVHAYADASALDDAGLIGLNTSWSALLDASAFAALHQYNVTTVHGQNTVVINCKFKYPSGGN
jgi:hypothetical protein